MDSLPKQRRSLLLSFKHSCLRVRAKLKVELDACYTCAFIGLNDRSVIPTDMPAILSSSVFGPCTIGDFNMARRQYNLIQMGVIPVMICDYCIMPFESMLDWSTFAVFIPERVFASPTFNLTEFLLNIPARNVTRMQKTVLKVRRHFIWHEGVREYDAMDMMVRELEKIGMQHRRYHRVFTNQLAIETEAEEKEKENKKNDTLII